MSLEIATCRCLEWANRADLIFDFFMHCLAVTIHNGLVKTLKRAFVASKIFSFVNSSLMFYQRLLQQSSKFTFVTFKVPYFLMYAIDMVF